MNRRLEEVIDQLADELMEEWRRYDKLSPEEKAMEDALLVAQMESAQHSGPCLQAPAQSKGKR